MRASSTRILTTHVGSLPALAAIDRADANYDDALRDSVSAIVELQREIGLDFINEGEYTKEGSWIAYIGQRFGGVRPGSDKKLDYVPLGKDREEFADFYKYANETGGLTYWTNSELRRQNAHWVCEGPLVYCGQAVLGREIDLLRQVVAPEDGFLTATAPSSFEVHIENAYYRTAEELLHAMAEAMRTEYEAIVAAGFDLQVDDAWLAALWDRIGIPMGLDAYRKYCTLRIEALNHALANIPQEQIRYHLCWGSWHGPHAHDLEMRHMVDLMLKVRAGAYSFEAANVRHEHEYAVWEDVKLPDGKLIMPGVVTHSTNVIEHPDLVSDRIQRFARLVGKENVIASADCGFGGRTHPQIAWAKLRALVEGARRASRALGFRAADD